MKMGLLNRERDLTFETLEYYDDNNMEHEMIQYYETARRKLTLEELLLFYSLDDIVRLEYDIKHTENLQRDIEALWENRMEEMVKEP